MGDENILHNRLCINYYATLLCVRKFERNVNIESLRVAEKEKNLVNFLFQAFIFFFDICPSWYRAFLVIILPQHVLLDDVVDIEACLMSALNIYWIYWFYKVFSQQVSFKPFLDSKIAAIWCEEHENCMNLGKILFYIHWPTGAFITNFVPSLASNNNRKCSEYLKASELYTPSESLKALFTSPSSALLSPLLFVHCSAIRTFISNDLLSR